VSLRTPTPRDGEPGPLTSLVDEVFRGASDGGRDAWAEGLAPGTSVGRYDLIREVGRGGFGVVWEARDRELGRRVAVKVVRVRREDAPEKRMVAEAEVAARLSHPGIVTILDVGRSEKGAWLVMEFLSGRTLAARLAEGALPGREALAVSLKACRALAHAHAHGVVHRDLSARNVFLCDDGQVKLLDLGMAQAFGRRKLEGGTPDSMAPEQARGSPEDERVDVYSLGVLIHRMVTGQAPFPPDTPADRRLAPHLETPELPGLGEVVDRMLAPDPMDRPRDAGAALVELEALEAALPRSSSGTRPGAVRVRRRWPRWARLSSAALALGAAALGGALAARRTGLAATATPAPLAISARSSSTSCDWGEATWTELDRAPGGAVVHGGEIGGQGIREAAGRAAWMQWSDWGALFLPLGKAGDADVFAVEAEFHFPAATRWQRGANMSVFSDPPAGDMRPAEFRHGFVVGVVEEPGRAPSFFLSRVVNGVAVRVHQGTLTGSLSGSWHTVRVEASRSGGWLRVLLDGNPLATLHGSLDLSGRYARLGSGYGYMNPEDVAWSNFRTFAGTPECQ
jgi:predicted Ser/Thr protein kinase